MKPEVTIYTDGSSNVHDERKPGGWAAVLMAGEHVRVIAGSQLGVTNNQMEILACVKGLAALKPACAVTLYSDSEYVIHTMKGINRKKKNPTWWDWLELAAQRHTIAWVHQKGHTEGESEAARWNGEADYWAGKARKAQAGYDFRVKISEYEQKKKEL